MKYTFKSLHMHYEKIKIKRCLNLQEKMHKIHLCKKSFFIDKLITIFYNKYNFKTDYSYIPRIWLGVSTRNLKFLTMSELMCIYYRVHRRAYFEHINFT